MDDDVHDFVKRWHARLMQQVLKESRSAGAHAYQGIVPFIAVTDDPGEALPLPPLSEIMQWNDEDLPHLYLVDQETRTTVPYPDKLDDIKQVSEPLVRSWAAMASSEIQVASFEKQIAEVEKAGEEDSDLMADMVKGLLKKEKKQLKSLKAAY